MGTECPAYVLHVLVSRILSSTYVDYVHELHDVLSVLYVPGFCRSLSVNYVQYARTSVCMSTTAVYMDEKEMISPESTRR